MSVKPNLLPPTPHHAQTYWDEVAAGYDYAFPETLIGRLQREAVWEQLIHVFKRGQRILEINCGTGIDATFLAGQGIRVVACDLSPQMIAIANQRTQRAGLAELVDFRVLTTESISTLAPMRPFDGLFSNFSGLNCVSDLRKAAHDLGTLVERGAPAILCMIGRDALWENLWDLAHGRFARAASTRRTRLARGASVEVAVPSVHEIVQVFQPEFRLKVRRGISVAVPPSSLNSSVSRFPRAVRLLASVDRWIAGVPGFRNLGDCVLLQFERN